MIARNEIQGTLKMLDCKFRTATSQKESLFYSKLAILELCGWIEESMDDVILRCARRHLKDKESIKFVEREIVKKTYGFDYQQHFRRMLIQLLGLINVERIETKIDQSKQISFKATLEPLRKVRDPEAHTHIKGVTRHINAPSVTLGQFPAIYEGLIEFDTVLRKMKF